jgi:O-antigen ligase
MKAIPALSPLTRGRIARLLPWLTLLTYLAVVTLGAFSGGMWAGTGIGLAILLFAGTAIANQQVPQPSRDFLKLALASLGIIAALNLLSFHAAASWYNWIRLVTIFLPLCLFSAPQLVPYAHSRHFFRIIALATFFGACALGTELFMSAPVTDRTHEQGADLARFNRGLSYVVLMAFPLMAALWTDRANDTQTTWRKKILHMLPILSFVLMVLYPCSLTESRAAKLALIVALVVILVGHIAPKFTRIGLKTLLILSLLWPYVVPKLFLHFQDQLGRIPPSWRARMEIWDYMSYRIAEHPWLGWGLGTSRDLDYSNPNGALYVITQAPAPHPHNVVTQLWVELGFPGLALGLIFALLTLRQASRLSRPLIPFAYGAWIAAFCLSLVAYNFWTDSLFAAFAFTGFAFALLDRRLRNAAV